MAREADCRLNISSKSMRANIGDGNYCNVNRCSFHLSEMISPTWICRQWKRIFYFAVSATRKSWSSREEKTILLCKWQIQVLVIHSRLTLQSRNEYLILELRHSKFELKNNKKKTFGTQQGSRGLIEFSDARKKWANHLWIQVEVETDPGCLKRKNESEAWAIKNL